MRLVVTPNEAAQMLVTSPDEIRRLIREGELPAYRTGSNYKIVIKQLESYIEERAERERRERCQKEK